MTEDKLKESNELKKLIDRKIYTISAIEKIVNEKGGVHDLEISSVCRCGAFLIASDKGKEIIDEAVKKALEIHKTELAKMQEEFKKL